MVYIDSIHIPFTDITISRDYQFYLTGIATLLREFVRSPISTI